MRDYNYSLHTRTRTFIVALLVGIALLSCLLTLAFLPSEKNAYAADAPTATAPFSGSGTELSPYEISSASDLVLLSELVNGGYVRSSDGAFFSACSYILTTDISMANVAFVPIGTESQSVGIFIDANDIVFSSPMANELQTYWTDFRQYFHYVYDGDYTPCNDATHPAAYDVNENYYHYHSFECAFYGDFDGNGHTISGLTVSSNDNAGLFGYAVNADIHDLTVDHATVSSQENAGAIVGKAVSSIVENCNVLSSSSSTSGVGTAAGSGVGCFAPDNDNSITIIAFSNPSSSRSFDMTDYLAPYFNTPKTSALSSCAAIDSSVLIGKAENMTIDNCLSDATPTDGTLVETGNNISLVHCLSVYGAYVGTATNVTYTNCLFPSDVVTDNDGIGFTTNELLTLSMYELFGSDQTKWHRSSSAGDTFYYPSPSPVHFAVCDAYRVRIDGELVTYINAADTDGLSFTLPSVSPDEGYSFAYYFLEADEETYDVGDTYELTGSVDFITYYSLDLTPSYLSDGNNGVIVDTYVADAIPLNDVGITNNPVYTLTYQWYSSSDNVLFNAYSTDSTLSLTEVSDSGYYYCSIIASVGSTNLSGNSFIDLPVIQYVIQPKAATLSPSATVGGETSATYVNSTFSLVYSCAVEGVYNSDLAGLQFVYSATKPGVSEVKTVGEYTVSVACNNDNYSFSVVPSSFTVTPATLGVTETNVLTTYDGASHAVSVSAVTVDGCAYSVLYSLDQTDYVAVAPSFTDCVNGQVVYYTVSADNHADVNGTLSATISPITVTVTAKGNAPLLSKIYDRSGAFPVGSVTSDHYDLSYSDVFAGDEPIPSVVSVLSPSASVGNVTVTVTFSLTDNNFVLGNTTVQLSGSISSATVSVTPLRAISSVYNGTTDFLHAVTQEDYQVNSTSSAIPALSARLAVANSENVSEATTLTVTFNMSETGFVFAQNGDVATFEFSLSEITLTFDDSKLHALDRSYDGTTDVEITFDSGVLVGIVPGDTVVLTIVKGTVPSANAQVEPYPVTLVDVSIANDNYVLTEDLPALTVVIGKATPDIHPVASSVAVYRSARALPILSLSAGDTPGSFVWNFGGVGSDDEWDDFVNEGELTFSYTFTPTDTANFLSLTEEMTFDFLEVTLVSLTYDNEYPDEYVSFDVFDTAHFSVWANYNDGTQVQVFYAPGYTGYSLVYENGGSLLIPSDTYVTVYYENIFVNVPVTVRKAVLNVTTDEVSFSFTGSARTFYPLGFDASVMTITGNSETDAGSYTAVVGLSQESSAYYLLNNNASTVSVVWHITPVGRYKLFLPIRLYTYSGEDISPAVRNDYNSTSDFYALTGDLTKTNAGTYTLTVSLLNDNYYWFEDPEEASYDIEWRIAPKTVPLPEIYDLPFVYNGVRHSVVVDENDAYTLTGDLTYTDAGSYAITATLESEQNYVWQNGTTSPVVLDYTVEKIKVAKPTVTNRVFTYSGEINRLRLSSTEEYAVTGDISKRDAGYYTTVVSLKDPTNYVWQDNTSENINVEWSVKRLSVALPTASGSVYYTGNQVTAPIIINTQYCSVRGNTATTAGSYVAYVSLRDTTNMVWSNGTTDAIRFDWTLNPVVVEKPTAPENVVYNGLEQTANLVRNSAYTVEGDVQTAAGTYTIKVTLSDKQNYNWTDKTTDDLTFTWKICSITLSSDGSDTLTTTYTVGDTLPTPYLSGYTFDGWYLTSDFTGERVDVLDEINADTKLYAKWVKEKTNNTPSISGLSSDNGTKKFGNLSEKAFIGVCIAGGALVIAVLIVIVGMFLRR